MRKDEFERRAAEMRARQAITKTTTINIPAVPSTARTIIKTATGNVPERTTSALTISELPSIPPYGLLRGIWKPAHTKMLLAALGEVHPLVVRAARALGSQQVNFDGLIYLYGDGAPDVAASTTAFPEALRLFDLLIRTVEQQGGSVSATKATTVSLDGEVIDVRMREGSERRRKEVGKYGLPENEYFPTKQLWLMVVGEHGSRNKTLVREHRDIDMFLQKLHRHAVRLPKIRERREKVERAHEEERERWQAKWRREEERQRQRKEQQQRLDQVFADVEQWTKAERIRAYAAAFETHHIATKGKVTAGEQVDGWLKWLHWYADHVDPLTRPEGPSTGPDEPTKDTEEP